MNTLRGLLVAVLFGAALPGALADSTPAPKPVVTQMVWLQLSGLT